MTDRYAAKARASRTIRNCEKKVIYRTLDLDGFPLLATGRGDPVLPQSRIELPGVLGDLGPISVDPFRDRESNLVLEVAGCILDRQGFSLEVMRCRSPRMGC